MYNRILSALAVFCQFLSLFPFVVLAEGVGFGEYFLWHYAVFYAAIAVFYICGRLLSAWAANCGFSRRGKSVAVFLSRTGFLVPTAVFIVICAILELHTGLYLYLLPGCIAAYFGGYSSAGKEYGDVFTAGWFAVFFVAALISAVLLSFTHDPQLSSGGMAQLCVSFGLLIILSAVLTNQTNIDIQTRQRSGGRAVLPKGTRGYNAWLIAVVGAVIVGLFMLTGPASRIISEGIKALIRWLLSLLRYHEEPDPDEGEMAENTAEPIDYPMNENPIAELLTFLLGAAAVFLIVKFRRQIWGFFKEIFAPLFKVPQRYEPTPFVDELSESGFDRISARERRRTERELYRRYRRETDPVLKYRQGYELFLVSLGKTPFPQLATDTTAVHCDKGGKAFSSRIPKAQIDGMVEVYNRVRYGGAIPAQQELEALDEVVRAVYK